jgi:hypothetical protein
VFVERYLRYHPTNVGHTEDEREVLVSQIVADEINRQSGTDYFAKHWRPDPPDALLVSKSGKHPNRRVEVVSTPQGSTMRYDRKNIRQFEQKLRAALHGLGLHDCDIVVCWSESAIQRGIKDALLLRLAEIIVATAPVNGYFLLRGVEIYDYSPEVAACVHYFRIWRLPGSILKVHSSHSFWSPADGRWILDAVENKAKKYRNGTLASNLMLIVDGLIYLDSEQIESFRRNVIPEQIPFPEVWVVSMGRAHRVKP